MCGVFNGLIEFADNLEAVVAAAEGVISWIVTIYLQVYIVTT